ncbi:retrovirus-related pol polyprotein from transposon TNT 1-94 [Tanacetum coccineum]
MLAPKGLTFNGRPTFANPMYLKKAPSKKPCLYEIPYDTSDLANRFVPDREETLTLEKENRSKLNKDLVKLMITQSKIVFMKFLNKRHKNIMISWQIQMKELVDQAWEKHSHDHFRASTTHDMEILIKTCLMPLALKTQNDSFKFVHELKQEMHADLKYIESLEKEIDELAHDKAEFSNMYDLLLQECVPQDVMCSYLHSLSDLDAHAEFFAKLEKYSISLELALQQCPKQMKNDTVFKEKASNVFLKEREQYFKIQDLKTQLQDKNIAISELKKLIEKCKGKSVKTKIDKSSIVRQPNAQRIPKPSVLGKPTPFSDSLERKSSSKTKSVPKNNVSQGIYRINTRPTQTRAPQLPQTSRNTDPRVFTSTRIIHRTNVSIPPLRSTQMKDKVVLNNSQVKLKKTEVEDHLGFLIVQLILFIVDSGSTKHMTGNLKLLCNFVKKYLGIVCFGNDQFALILGYGDLAQGNITINKVYYVESLNYNLLSVGQFCDANLEKDIVIGLPKLKYVKDQLCSSFEVSKAKRSSFKTKAVPSLKGWLNLLHIDLCGPMQDETPEVLKDFLKMIQRNLQAQVITVRSDRGTEFLNKTLHAYLKEEGNEHQTSTPRTPEQNGVVVRRNRTLVEAARTMLSASKLPLFFWAEAIITACYTQNRSIIIPTHEKTTYHIINDRKPSIRHLHIFGCTCYLTRDGENLDKMKEKGNSCILDNFGPAPQLQNVSPSADTTAPSQQELDLLFGPLYDEFFTPGTSSVNKSSSPTQPTANIHPSTEPITLTTTVYAKENNDNQAADTQFQHDEFINPFCTLVREVAEFSSCNIDNLNMHTFY